MCASPWRPPESGRRSENATFSSSPGCRGKMCTLPITSQPRDYRPFRRWASTPHARRRTTRLGTRTLVEAYRRARDGMPGGDTWARQRWNTTRTPISASLIESKKASASTKIVDLLDVCDQRPPKKKIRYRGSLLLQERGNTSVKIIDVARRQRQQCHGRQRPSTRLDVPQG